MWELLKPLIGPTVSKVLDRIPNPNARAEAKEELEQTLISGLEKANEAQAEINKIEAAHKSLFVAGWRPSIGWTCSLGLFWHFLGQHFAAFVIVLIGSTVQLPVIDSGDLLELTMALLGMAGLRSWEKSRGIARPQ